MLRDSRAGGTRGLLATKLWRLARARAYWRPALGGVVAAVEHADVPFRSDPATVLDVGASRGQFALFALRRFPRAHVVSFEPLAEARSKIEAAVPPGRVTVHPVALGEEPGEVEMHVSARDDSSSVLPIGERQIEAFPGTEEQSTVRVEVRRLEDFLGPDVPRPVLLKVDVQGFEDAVLAGAGAALERIDEALVECSFVELYTGQSLADAVVSRMRDAGLRLIGVHGLVQARDGSCLQADFHFERASS